MKFQLTRRFKHKAIIDITPLIDLVFLLVAFFMVTSSLGSESSITINLPKAHESGNYKSGSLIITVDEKNLFYINDKKISKKNLVSEFSKRKKSNKKISVVIRGDRKSNYESIIYVIDKLNKAGIGKFIISSIR